MLGFSYVKRRINGPKWFLGKMYSPYRSFASDNNSRPIDKRFYMKTNSPI